MLSSQNWFSLSLKPRFLSNLYNTYVRSILLYGSELLLAEKQWLLVYVDEILVRNCFKKTAEAKMYSTTG